MEQYLRNYEVLEGLAAFACLVMLIDTITAMIYHKLLVQSEKMATTKNKWLKGMIVRLEACFQMRMQPRDVGVLVDNYILQYRFMGIPLTIWKNAGGGGIGLLCLGFIAELTAGYYYQMPLDWFVDHLVVISSILTILVVYGGLCQIWQKEEKLRCQILDYLNNVLLPRLENQYLHQEETKAYREQYFEEDSMIGEPGSFETAEKEKDVSQLKQTQSQIASSDERLRLLQEVLDEFF